MDIWEYLIFYVTGLIIAAILIPLTAILIKGTYIVVKDIYTGNFFND